MILLYPNKAKKDYKKFTSYANRGMDLEDAINNSNNYYLEKDIAIIYKKPTSITIKNATFKNGKRIITEAYFKTPSTLDYNGIYKGKYIDFDAKETKSKTSFPINNIHKHQLKHMKDIIRHGGISFLLILINNVVYLLDGNDIFDFIDNNDRKSIPYEYIVKKGIPINTGYYPQLDYIKAIDKRYGGDYFGK